MTTYGKELFMTFWGRMGGENPQIPVNRWFSMSVIALKAVGEGVGFPSTVLSIHDGFETEKHLLTEENDHGLGGCNYFYPMAHIFFTITSLKSKEIRKSRDVAAGISDSDNIDR